MVQNYAPINSIKMTDIIANELKVRLEQISKKLFKNLDSPIDVSNLEYEISYESLVRNIRSCNLNTSRERICLHDKYGRRITDSRADPTLLIYENYINHSIGTPMGVPILWSVDGYSVPAFVFSSSANRVEARIIKRLDDLTGITFGYINYAYAIEDLIQE